MSMLKGSDHEQRSVILPGSVLGVLKDVPAGALKVFIYLCSCNQGQPFEARIPTVADATGRKPRSVISALKALRKHQLIARISGRGNKPNQYSIPVLELQETAAPPTGETAHQKSVLSQATPLAATPTRAITPEHITEPPSTKSDQATAPSPAPPPATIRELIAACYRTINDGEFAEVKQAYPDEAVLRKKVERFRHDGCLAPHMEIDYFIRSLRRYA
jgi:hypothetical protein